MLILLRTRTGQDFSPYKKQTVYRRIERRMGIHQIDRIASYARYLQENPQEVDLLSKELLIGVTSFFREPAAWDLLRDKAIPSLIAGSAGRRDAARLVGGVLDGEEAYSLAIVFKEALDRLKPKGGSRCRSSPPTWTGTRSTRRVRGSGPPPSPRTSLPSACAASSPRRRAATGSARRSGRW